MKSLTGKEFMALTNKKSSFGRCVGFLFSRAKLKHKQEIVRLLEEDGEVISIRGNKVNDAPTLKWLTMVLK